MTVKDFLSSLGTLNVQVIIKDSEGTMICKIFSTAVDSLEESLLNEKITHWSIVRTTLIVVNLEGEEPPIEPVAVTSVELSSESLELNVGETAELSATVLPEDATIKEVTWEVADTEIISFEDGIVTALAEGATTITVTTTDGGFTATCGVLVNPNE